MISAIYTRFSQSRIMRFLDDYTNRPSGYMAAVMLGIILATNIIIYALYAAGEMGYTESTYLIFTDPYVWITLNKIFGIIFAVLAGYSLLEYLAIWMRDNVLYKKQ